MLVNHKIQFFQIFLEIYFYRTISFLFFSAIIHLLCYYLPVYYLPVYYFIILCVLFFYTRFLRWVRYAGRIFNAVSAREGDLKVPKPERPPSRSHPVGHGKSVTSSMCNTVDSCLYSSVFRMQLFADPIFCMLRYSKWFSLPIWFSTCHSISKCFPLPIRRSICHSIQNASLHQFNPYTL